MKKPGLRYRKSRLLLPALAWGNNLTPLGAHALLRGCARFAAWNTQALAAFPQAFTADAQFACKLGLSHVFLVLENEVLEVVFQ